MMLKKGVNRAAKYVVLDNAAPIKPSEPNILTRNAIPANPRAHTHTL